MQTVSYNVQNIFSSPGSTGGLASCGTFPAAFEDELIMESRIKPEFIPSLSKQAASNTKYSKYPGKHMLLHAIL